MEMRRLGRTELKVSRIGFGGMTIPQVDKKQAVETVNKALDLGVNFIDTARAYGDSEEKIGEVMRTRRKECFLSSRMPQCTYEAMKMAIEKGLKTLQTEHIDLYEAHDVSTEKRYNNLMQKGGLKALKEAKKEGKIGHIGFTSHNWELTKKLIETGEFEAGLIVYNLADREAEEEVIPLAREYDVGLFIMKVFGNGRLLEQTPAGSQRKPTIGECLRFALSNKDLPLILTGAKSPEEISQNVAIAEKYTPLTAKEDKSLRQFGDSLRRGYCYNCSYCLPCPAKIDIPVIMRLLEARERRDWHTVHPELKAEYARQEKTIDDCTDCGQCEESCPQKLPVRERLKKAKEMLG